MACPPPFGAVGGQPACLPAVQPWVPACDCTLAALQELGGWPVALLWEGQRRVSDPAQRKCCASAARTCTMQPSVSWRRLRSQACSLRSVHALLCLPSGLIRCVIRPARPLSRASPAAQAPWGGWCCPPPGRWRLSSTWSRRQANSLPGAAQRMRPSWPACHHQEMAAAACSLPGPAALAGPLQQLLHISALPAASPRPAAPLHCAALKPSCLHPPCRMRAAPSRPWPTSATSTSPST